MIESISFDLMNSSYALRCETVNLQNSTLVKKHVKTVHRKPYYILQTEDQPVRFFLEDPTLHLLSFASTGKG
jgi:hypothetical protein